MTSKNLPQRSHHPVLDAWIRWRLARSGPWSSWHMLDAHTEEPCCDFSAVEIWEVEYGSFPDAGCCAVCQRIFDKFTYVEAV